MTSPIERAAEAVEHLDWTQAEFGYVPENEEIARAVFESIDRDELVKVMRDRDDMFVTFEMHADAIITYLKGATS